MLFGFAYLAIHLAPAGWWPGAMQAQGVPDQQAAFAALFGQGMWAIGGSITAFFVGPANRRTNLSSDSQTHRRALDLVARYWFNVNFAGVHKLIEGWLGHLVAHEMREKAAQ